MPVIQLTVLAQQTKDELPYQHLHIQITTPDGIVEPQDLRGLTLPEVQWQQGIVLEGKAPIWLYSYLVHACHPASWVACYDPRLGAVVVATHTHAVSIGQILSVSIP
jgi:CRISPR-associated protein Csx3